VQSSPAYTLANNTTTTAYSNASYGMASSQQSPDNGLSDAGGLEVLQKPNAGEGIPVRLKPRLQWILSSEKKQSLVLKVKELC